MDKATIAALTAPFDDSEVKFAPKQFRNGKAQVFPFLDAPTIMQRLNEVLTPFGWSWHVRELPDGCMVGTLSIKDGDTWVTREGVGAPARGNHIEREGITIDALNLYKLGTAEPAAEGKERINRLKSMINDVAKVVDASKAAESDALKRASMKFGIGNELWREWEARYVEWDFDERCPAISHEEIVALCKKGAVKPVAARAASGPPPVPEIHTPNAPPDIDLDIPDDDEIGDLTSELSDIIGEIGD